MDNTLTLEAGSTMFDELGAILKHGDCVVELRATKSVARGIRRTDAVCYRVVLGDASVELWAERRVGNPTILVTVVPKRKSIWRSNSLSDTLASQIVDLLMTHRLRYD